MLAISSEENFMTGYRIVFDREKMVLGWKDQINSLYNVTADIGLLDVKPCDDETVVQKPEEIIRGIQMEGLHWGALSYLNF